MSRKLEDIFITKEINYDKLNKYGFKKEKNKYVYRKNICDNTFLVEVVIADNNKYSKVIDCSLDEEYILVDTQSTNGYINEVKNEYEKVINDIIINCTTNDVFKNDISKEALRYIKDKYGDSEEYLWEKFPETAVIRNKNNNKWYALIMAIPENKIGIDGTNKIDIINLRYYKDSISNIIDNKQIFLGYHMNKNNWITIKLDDNIDKKYLYQLIDISYSISLNK